MAKNLHKYLDLNSEESFTCFYRDYYPRLLRIARYYLQEKDSAIDLMAEIFSKLWENRTNLDKIKDLENYLFIMVKRRCLDELNKSHYKSVGKIDQVNPQTLICFRNPEVTYLDHELKQNLKDSIDRLPAKCRTVFLMVKEDQLKYREVACLLQISEKTVEMHVANALKALRKDLEYFHQPARRPALASYAKFLNLITFFI